MVVVTAFNAATAILNVGFYAWHISRGEFGYAAWSGFCACASLTTTVVCAVWLHGD